jgi:hypothetical protein
MNREALDLIASQLEAWESVHMKPDAEPHHYDTCGRDHVWLENGVIPARQCMGRLIRSSTPTACRR